MNAGLEKNIKKYVGIAGFIGLVILLYHSTGIVLHLKQIKRENKELAKLEKEERAEQKLLEQKTNTTRQ